MVGSAIHRKLLKEGFTNFVTRTSKELDLKNQQAVADFFAMEKPEYVFLAAARVGGIIANNTYGYIITFKPKDGECLCQRKISII